MDGVRQNTFVFKCPICICDGPIRGQPGGRSMVKTSCPASHVFHLGCISKWLDRQAPESLHRRKCSQCNYPALPLLRMDGLKVRDDESRYCETWVFNACRTGNLADLRMLLREDETLANRTYRSVCTGHLEHPLVIAIKNQHTDLVRLLINYHADVNIVEHDGETPLRIAARLRRTGDLKMLIDAGADINKLLLFAIRMNKTELLEYLISTKPNPAKLNSALHKAVGQGQTQCFKPLVNMGANDLNGALCKAAELGRTQCLNPLINLGANDRNGALREAAEQGQTQCLKPLINMGANDLDGALREAARSGETQCLELLLNEGAKDLYGALYIAILTGNNEARDILIRKGADINTVLRTPDSEDVSMEAHISRIISRYINATDESGTTPLHIAAARGHATRLQELIETRGVDVNATDSHGETALRLAACCGHTEAVKVLLNNSGTCHIQVNAKNGVGTTALHFAAWNGHTKTVKVLVAARRINVNEKNINGWTALHIAARYASPETVKVLVSAIGINVNEKQNDGWTALDLAWKYGFPESKKLLEDKGAVYNKMAVFNKEDCVIQ